MTAEADSVANWVLPQVHQTAAGVARYMISGRGPPLVLVHGTPWSSFSWHRVVSRLAERFTVHLYDLPGYGRSEMRDGQDVSLSMQGLTLAEMIQHWGLSRPLVAGHDFGGAIALRAHLLGKIDFAALALLNAVALAPWGSPFFAHVRKHTEAFESVPPYIHKAVLEAYIKGAMTGRIADSDFAALVAPWLTEAGQSAFYRQIAQADQKFTDEIEPLYRSIRCPSLVIWGADDPWIPLATGQQLHDAIPGSQLRTVAGVGHLVQLEAPDEVAGYLLDFYAANRARTS